MGKVKKGQRVPDHLMMEDPIGFFVKDFVLLRDADGYYICIEGRVYEVFRTKAEADSRLKQLKASINRFLVSLAQPPRATPLTPPCRGMGNSAKPVDAGCS